MKHKLIPTILASLTIATVAAVGVCATDAPTITVSGETVAFPDQQPLIKNDRTLVPIRFIAESLGYEVDWNPTDHSAVIDDGRIVLYIGTNHAVIDGQPIELDVASELINDRTMVPLRIVAETLDCTVDWFDSNRTVLINPREDDGSEMSLFERYEQSGLFESYETAAKEYLVRSDRFVSPDNDDAWWIERVKDKSTLANQSLDCSIMIRSFNPDELGEVREMLAVAYPTGTDEAYEILMQTIRGELWETFYREDSELYPLYSAKPTTSGTFGTTYLDGRQVEMYANNTCTRVTIQICDEGYVNTEVPRQLEQSEIDFHTKQAKSRYCLELWGLK